MRQFVLGGNVAYATENDFSAIPEGAVGFYYFDNGKLTSTSTGAEIKKEAMIVYGRPAAKGGNKTIPFFNNNFSYTKSVYAAGTKFNSTITVPAPKKIGDYSIIIVKKGCKFNERNKWTATVHVTDTNMTDQQLAEALVKKINFMTTTNGITASNRLAVVTIENKVDYTDYSIIPADELMGTEVTSVHIGYKPFNDANYIKELAMQAAADEGFEYTFKDSHEYLYPDYPINPLKANDAVDAGFTIFTLRYAEPRDTKTHDQAVNQIVQIAFPTGAGAIATFETVCKNLAGESTPQMANLDSGSSSEIAG